MNYYQKKAQELLEDIPEGPRFSWEFRQRELAKKIIAGDLPNLLSWPIVREALHAGYGRYSARDRELVPDNLVKYAKDPPVGNSSARFSQDGASGTFIRQVLVSHMIDKKFAPIESINSILEFGGGYGASEVVFRRRGFRGDHYVYDFPIMHLIREWYLSRNRGHTGFLTLPLTDIPEGLQTDVFVSVCSIDEAPVKLRNDFMDGFTSTFYLFIVTNVYDGVDNKVWCGQWLDDNNIAYRVIRLASGNQTMFIGERI